MPNVRQYKSANLFYKVQKIPIDYLTAEWENRPRFRIFRKQNAIFLEGFIFLAAFRTFMPLQFVYYVFIHFQFMYSLVFGIIVSRHVYRTI
jgi:hypothetical protein